MVECSRSLARPARTLGPNIDPSTHGCQAKADSPCNASVKGGFSGRRERPAPRRSGLRLPLPRQSRPVAPSGFGGRAIEFAIWTHARLLMNSSVTVHSMDKTPGTSGGSGTEWLPAPSNDSRERKRGRGFRIPFRLTVRCRPAYNPPFTHNPSRRPAGYKAREGLRVRRTPCTPQRNRTTCLRRMCVAAGRAQRSRRPSCGTRIRRELCRTGTGLGRR